MGPSERDFHISYSSNDNFVMSDRWDALVDKQFLTIRCWFVSEGPR